MLLRFTAKPATGILNPLPEIAGQSWRVTGRGPDRGCNELLRRNFPLDAARPTLRCTPSRLSGKIASKGWPGMGFVIGPVRAAGWSARVGTAARSPLDLLDQWAITCKKKPVSGASRPQPMVCRRPACRRRSVTRHRGGQPRFELASLHCQLARPWFSGKCRRFGFGNIPARRPAGAHHQSLFHAPPDPAYNFGEFYRRVRERGFILYPGKLTTRRQPFRVGCHRGPSMRAAFDAGRVAAIAGRVCGEMGVTAEPGGRTDDSGPAEGPAGDHLDPALERGGDRRHFARKGPYERQVGSSRSRQRIGARETRLAHPTRRNVATSAHPHPPRSRPRPSG